VLGLPVRVGQQGVQEVGILPVVPCGQPVERL
jgi:hypothetical protein